MATRKSLWQVGAEQVAGLLQTLRTWPWFDTLRTLRQRFREDHLGLTASSLTFTTMVSLVPLVTVALALFAAFPVFDRFEATLRDYFVQSLAPDSIARPVMAALTQFAGKASRLGAAGFAFLVASALVLMLTIDHALNAIWRVRKPRPIAQRVLVYWAALTLGPLLLGGSLSLSSYALSASRGLVDALPGGLSVGLEVLDFALLALAMAALYRYVPNTWVPWRHALAGGLFVAVGLEVAKRALAWYVRAVPGISVIYGAFATLPILLLWIYLSWLIVLFGAVIAAYAPSLQMHLAPVGNAAGRRFALAAQLLRDLRLAAASPPYGMTLAQCAARLRTDPLQVEPLLELLVTLGWAARVDEAGEQRFVLLCNPAATLAAPLVDRLLLAPDARVVAFRRHAAIDELTVAQLIDG